MPHRHIATSPHGGIDRSAGHYAPGLAEWPHYADAPTFSAAHTRSSLQAATNTAVATPNSRIHGLTAEVSYPSTP